MKKYLTAAKILVVSFILAVAISLTVVFPVIYRYPKIYNLLNRFRFSFPLIVIFLFLLILFGWIQSHRKKISIYYLSLIYPVYLLSLIVLLFAKNGYMSGIQLNPLTGWLYHGGVSETLFNVIGFIPLGAIYFLASKKQTLIISIITVLGIETAQYIFNVGTFSTLDIITNVIGIMIGRYLLDYFRNKGIHIG